jgi:prefoldin subunit 5
MKMLKVLALLLLFTTFVSTPLDVQNFLKNSVAISLKKTVQKFTKNSDSKLSTVAIWTKSILKSVATWVCVVYVGALLYNYLNPPDEYYTEWSAQIFDKLKNNKDKLFCLSECIDEDIIIYTLFELIRSGEKEFSSIELFDTYLKNIEKEINSIIKQLKKRIEKTSKQNGTTSAAILDCFNKLQTQQSILEKVRQIEEKYGCFINIYQLCEKLPIIYAQELHFIEENMLNRLDEEVSRKLEETNKYYDSYVEAIIINIVNLEKELSKCTAIKPEYPWIKNSTVILNRLKKLATILIFSGKYLNAIAATRMREYLQGSLAGCAWTYRSQPTCYCPTYTYYHPVNMYNHW